MIPYTILHHHDITRNLDDNYHYKYHFIDTLYQHCYPLITLLQSYF